MLTMMMRENSHSYPTLEIPQWAHSINHNATALSPDSKNAFDELTAFHHYLPSNVQDSNKPVDAITCDNFRMYEFKIKRCPRARSHDWTECPYAHPDEKARRRDPRKFHYSGHPCPEFKKGYCVKGESCEYSHGVFECWLHPSRYRTQPCKDGTHCGRRVCFFAHTPDQLRHTTHSYDSFDYSPGRLSGDSLVSPSSCFHSPPESPPASPSSLSQLAGSMRNLQIGKIKMGMSPPSWGYKIGSGFCSPRSPSTLRPAFMSVPSTPTGSGFLDSMDYSYVEEPVMERVESGRELRAKMYAKLSKENSLVRVDPVDSDGSLNCSGLVFSFHT